jgi:hypothetical protein
VVGGLPAATDEVKQPAELAVRVPPARFQLHRQNQVLGIGVGTVPDPAVGEQPDAIPDDRERCRRRLLPTFVKPLGGSPQDVGKGSPDVIERIMPSVGLHDVRP